MSSGLPKPCPITPEILFRIQFPFLYSLVMPSIKRTSSSSGASAPKKPRTAPSSAGPVADSLLTAPFSAVAMNNVVNGPILGTDMTMDMAEEKDSFTAPSASSSFVDLSTLSPAAAANMINASPDEATTEELAVNDQDLDIPSEELNAKGVAYHALQLPPNSERNPGLSLIDLLDTTNDVKNELFTFANTCMQTNRSEAIVPVESFLDGNPGSWATHCPNSDYMWNEFVEECQSLGVPLDTVNKMAKFSGPVTANLNITWHYPTHNTKIRNPPRDCKFGFVADPTNPCIKFQFRKLGPNGRVCTNDLLPFRADYSNSGVKWQESIPNFASVEEKALDLTMALHDYSRVHIVVGKEAHDAIKQRLEQDKGKVVQKLFINLQGLAPFGEKPHMLVVRHAPNNVIHSLVFFSYHAQTFFYLNSPLVGLYHDFIWNAACQLANIPVAGEDVFFRMTSSPKKGKPRGNLAALIEYRHIEKECNSFLDEKTALQLFASTIRNEQDWFNENFPKKGSMSVVELLLRHMSARGIETQRAAGFPGLARGRETERAAGFPGLAKGREIQRAAGFPELAKGRETQRAAGFPALARAHETRRAAGFPALARGRETQRAAGFPVLARSREVRQTKSLAKKQALLNLPEVRHFLDHADTTHFPNIKEKTLTRTAIILGELRQEHPPARANQWLSLHARFYSKKTPNGIRFDGDGGPPITAVATAPLTHSCLNLFTKLEKEA